MPKNDQSICRSFKPFVDKQTRVLILGSMPGPEALRKQQYYGFDGNHFWAIIPALLGQPRPQSYEDKLKLVKANRIGLWDVLESCQRMGALDSAIREPRLNPIPRLLKEFPNIKAIFINGRTAYNLFVKNFSAVVSRPYFYLPSTSPANAAMILNEKIRQWSIIKEFLSQDPRLKKKTPEGKPSAGRDLRGNATRGDQREIVMDVR